jgi:hypothetical protein
MQTAMEVLALFKIKDEATEPIRRIAAEAKELADQFKLSPTKGSRSATPSRLCSRTWAQASALRRLRCAPLLPSGQMLSVLHWLQVAQRGALGASPLGLTSVIVAGADQAEFTSHLSLCQAAAALRLATTPSWLASLLGFMAAI